MSMPAGALRAELPAQTDVLRDMHPRVRSLMSAHLDQRRLWFPNDFLNADEDGASPPSHELRERARGLPDAVRVSLALNLLTEEGLPHFHRLLSHYLGDASPWVDWNNLWTAEEDRHGCVLRDYVREARIFDMGALERLQYAYLESGFNPDWGRDLYRILAYTSLQERATQRAHANTGRQCAAHEPVIQRILAHICADESRHYDFYRQCFAALLERDPDGGLQALLAVAPALAMPGHNIEGYAEMSEVVRRAGIYGPRQYTDLVEELLDDWSVGTLPVVTAAGREAQDRLMRLPAKLRRVSDYRERKNGRREFAFPFLPGRDIRL